jgi:hypothetical protein
MEMASGAGVPRLRFVNYIPDPKMSDPFFRVLIMPSSPGVQSPHADLP